MEQTITVHWDRYVEALMTLPDPAPKRIQNIQTGEDFLERMMSQDLPGEYLLNLSDDTIETSWEIISHESSGADALLDVAQMRVDDSVWDATLRQVFQLSSICDPAIQDAFI